MDKNFPGIDIPIVLKLYELYKAMHIIIRDFPKFERYSLGENIEKNILDAIRFAISANNETKYNKEKYLIGLGSQIELLKILLRLAFDLEFFKKETDYIKCQSILQEIGKMSSGWTKYIRSH